MSGREELWRRIDAALEADDQLAPEDCLSRLGVTADPLAERLGDVAADLLAQAFDADDLTAEIGGERYRVLSRLDAGGQSDVYLAERADGVYSKTVVIKLLAGHHARKLMHEQFLREMQLLADLPHPGIVQILDGGVGADGRPWLVLEHVDGPHLDTFCRERSLPVRDVVRLFRDLCDALHFIHLRGVVHMDIKSANVLVRDINGAAYPVLIDFGIALEAAGLGDARPGVVFGTPGFAAPEQLAGEAADPRADLYSLGMLLAQVLTNGDVPNVGMLPREERAALLRSHRVPRDLREVIEKCTRQRRARRYASAEALRTDLDAWLNDLPLAASRHHPLHVAAKALRRHALAASVAALALAGAAFATWKYTADVTELQRVTQAEKNASDNLFNFMLGDLFERLTAIGRIDLLRLVAERSIAHLERQDQRTLDDTARLQAAAAFANAGRVFDALEQSADALHAYGEAKDRLAPLEGNAEHERPWLRQMAGTLVLESQTRATEGQRIETEAALRRAIELAGRLVETYPDASREPLWEAQLQLGWHLMEYDEPEAAREALLGALETAEAVAEASEDGRWRMNLSQSWQALAWHAFDYGGQGQALDALARGLEAARAARAFGDDIEYLHNHRILLNQKAYFLTQEEDFDEAAGFLREAIAIGRQLGAMAPQNRNYERELAYSYTTAGETAERRGDLREALAHYERGLAISRNIAAADTGGYSAANDYAVDLVSVANVLARLGDAAQAGQLWREAATLMEPVWRAEPDNKYYQYTLAVAWIQLGRYDDARPLVEGIVEAGMDDGPFRDLLAEHGLTTGASEQSP